MFLQLLCLAANGIKQAILRTAPAQHKLTHALIDEHLAKISCDNLYAPGSSGPLQVVNLVNPRLSSSK